MVFVLYDPLNFKCVVVILWRLFFNRILRGRQFVDFHSSWQVLVPTAKSGLLYMIMSFIVLTTSNAVLVCHI